MALIRSMTVNEVSYPEAYSKIETIRCDKMNCYIFVCSYVNEAARAAHDYPFFAEEHIADISVINGDTFTVAYEYLKTLPAYEGAVDHFDVIPIIEELPPLDPNLNA